MTYAEIAKRIKNGENFDVIAPNGELVKDGRIADEFGYRVQVWNEKLKRWESFGISHCKVIFK